MTADPFSSMTPEQLADIVRQMQSGEGGPSLADLLSIVGNGATNLSSMTEGESASSAKAGANESKVRNMTLAEFSDYLDKKIAGSKKAFSMTVTKNFKLLKKSYKESADRTAILELLIDRIATAEMAKRKKAEMFLWIRDILRKTSEPFDGDLRKKLMRLCLNGFEKVPEKIAIPRGRLIPSFKLNKYPLVAAPLAAISELIPKDNEEWVIAQLREWIGEKLLDPSWTIRVGAVLAVSRCIDAHYFHYSPDHLAQVFDWILLLAADQSEWVRLAVADACAIITRKYQNYIQPLEASRVVPALLTLMSDKNPNVQGSAISCMDDFADGPKLQLAPYYSEIMKVLLHVMKTADIRNRTIAIMCFTSMDRHFPSQDKEHYEELQTARLGVLETLRDEGEAMEWCKDSVKANMVAIVFQSMSRQLIFNNDEQANTHGRALLETVKANKYLRGYVKSKYQPCAMSLAKTVDEMKIPVSDPLIKVVRKATEVFRKTEDAEHGRPETMRLMLDLLNNCPSAIHPDVLILIRCMGGQVKHGFFIAFPRSHQITKGMYHFLTHIEPPFDAAKGQIVGDFLKHVVNQMTEESRKGFRFDAMTIEILWYATYVKEHMGRDSQRGDVFEMVSKITKNLWDKHNNGVDDLDEADPEKRERIEKAIHLDTKRQLVHAVKYWGRTILPMYYAENSADTLEYYGKEILPMAKRMLGGNKFWIPAFHIACGTSNFPSGPEHDEFLSGVIKRAVNQVVANEKARNYGLTLTPQKICRHLVQVIRNRPDLCSEFAVPLYKYLEEVLAHPLAEKPRVNPFYIHENCVHCLIAILDNCMESLKSADLLKKAFGTFRKYATHTNLNFRKSRAVAKMKFIAKMLREDPELLIGPEESISEAFEMFVVLLTQPLIKQKTLDDCIFVAKYFGDVLIKDHSDEWEEYVAELDSGVLLKELGSVVGHSIASEESDEE